ncbi:hypothetical protein CesoFtcFv8_004671 [Champsocephalus esox]|uniref:Uncharacterized protein n=2 Tax=Champsocephalus TaxID=52236 RepID=A0AAN8DX48_CHAGU|nr:hypothetical protein CesoFtcFv8_004671 [Champsocephalus esox]KAK5930332.1 hypothetical protein CgunFtcFv8_026573 [Champsocephalus gunnari]
MSDCVAALLSQEIIKAAAMQRLEPVPGGWMETLRALLFDKKLFTENQTEACGLSISGGCHCCPIGKQTNKI